jgi:hypothetical protein
MQEFWLGFMNNVARRVSEPTLSKSSASALADARPHEPQAADFDFFGFSDLSST